jgi:hypothetical protein
LFYSRPFYRVDVQGGWGAWDRVVSVSAEVKKTARYWLRHFDKWNSSKIWNYNPARRVHVWTDASETGWGGHLDEFERAEATGVFDAALLGSSSNRRELYGALMVLCSLVSFLRDGLVLLVTDSQNMYFILRKGGSMVVELNEIVEQIFNWCAENNVKLWVEWNRRNLNVRADELSNVVDRSDWKLLPRWFNLLSRRWGPFDVDRFASHLNAQLPVFNSLYWCPGTAGVNSLTLNWAGVNNWINPDYSKVGEVLIHMRHCKARGCLIIPWWPSRPWFHLLFPDGVNKGPNVLHVWYFPKNVPLFAEAYAGSITPRPPKFQAVAVYVSYE